MGGISDSITQKLPVCRQWKAEWMGPWAGSCCPCAMLEFSQTSGFKDIGLLNLSLAVPHGCLLAQPQFCACSRNRYCRYLSGVNSVCFFLLFPFCKLLVRMTSFLCQPAKEVRSQEKQKGYCTFHVPWILSFFFLELHNWSTFGGHFQLLKLCST